MFVLQWQNVYTKRVHLELQLGDVDQPLKLMYTWKKLLSQYGSTATVRGEVEVPTLHLWRNVFASPSVEKMVSWLIVHAWKHTTTLTCSHANTCWDRHITTHTHSSLTHPIIKGFHSTTKHVPVPITANTCSHAHNDILVHMQTRMWTCKQFTGFRSTGSGVPLCWCKYSVQHTTHHQYYMLLLYHQRLIDMSSTRTIPAQRKMHSILQGSHCRWLECEKLITLNTKSSLVHWVWDIILI